VLLTEAAAGRVLCGRVIQAAPSPADIATLIEDLRTRLERTGCANDRLEDLAVPIDVWRRAARRAARMLERPVQTLVSQRAAHAALLDWPANDAERAATDAALRAAIRAVAVVDATRR
jgi:hypothetical protein